MPRVKNKKTGVAYSLTNAEYTALLNNPSYKMGFEVITGIAELPAEVKEMREQKAESEVKKEPVKPPRKRAANSSKNSEVE